MNRPLALAAGVLLSIFLVLAGLLAIAPAQALAAAEGHTPGQVLLRKLDRLEVVVQGDGRPGWHGRELVVDRVARWTENWSGLRNGRTCGDSSEATGLWRVNAAALREWVRQQRALDDLRLRVGRNNVPTRRLSAAQSVWMAGWDARVTLWECFA